MQKLSQKWTLVSFLQSVPTGIEFAREDWPHHVSLADTFAIGIDAEELYKILATGLKGQDPTETTVLGGDIFGTDEVVLLQQTNKLQKLHNAIIKLLKDHGADFSNPQYIENGFLPHITLHGRLVTNEKNIKINDVTIVDMFPGGDGNRRKVLKTIKLAN